MGWVRKSMRCAAAAVIVMCMPSLLQAGPPPAFGKVTIPRVSSPPRLEDFLEMKPSPAWQGKMARIDQFVQRTPSDGEPVSHDVDGNLLHSGRLKNDGRGLFVKASYLFRF